jgi:hypothetical protein
VVNEWPYPPRPRWLPAAILGAIAVLIVLDVVLRWVAGLLFGVIA